MAGNERFTYQDLLGLQVYGELTSKVEEVFQLIEPELKARFGKTGGGVSATSQVTSKDRLAIWCEGVLGNSGWSEVLISFQFTGSRNTDGPQLVVQLWISKNNDSYSDLRKAVDKLEEYSFTDDIEYNGGRLRYDKPLAEFIESENQINEITTWITNRLEDLHQLIEKTSNLNWNTA